MNLERFDKDIFKKLHIVIKYLPSKKNSKKTKKLVMLVQNFYKKKLKSAQKFIFFEKIIQITEYLQTFIVIMPKAFFLENQ